MVCLRPAERYLPAPDLAVITCYFNPNGYRSKRANYEVFIASLRSAGLAVVVVECAFADQPFALPPAADVVQVRSQSVLFQKERLLNLALTRLPPQITKVAWLDCDVLFCARDWAARTAAALEQVPMIQPFTRAFRLPPGASFYEGEGDAWPSFAAACAEAPERLTAGNFDAHGHTGFAWAARRALLDRHGLYDAMVAGSFDHMLAHAIFGDWNSACVRRIVGVGNPYAADLRAWCRRFYADVQGRLGAVPGDLLHLWHGSMAKRRYVERAQQLVGLGFDPRHDIVVGPEGTWEWASSKPALHQWARDYFAARDEDERPADGEAVA